MGEIFRNLALGVPMTLGLTLGALALGALLGVPLCAARVAQQRWLRGAAALVILSFRSIPPLVWLFLIYFGLGSGVVKLAPVPAALLGLGLIAAVTMAEIYRGALAAVQKGQWEACLALGLPRRTMLLEIIGPQVARISLPASATFAIALLKDSAVASTIGVRELAFQGTSLSQQTFRGLEIFALVGLLYIGLSLPIAWASRRIDARVRRRVAR